MIASRTAAGRAEPQVTLHCKMPGGPWFVGLGGRCGPEVQLGPYENPAIAQEDAAKLRQFLAAMICGCGDPNVRGDILPTTFGGGTASSP